MIEPPKYGPWHAWVAWRPVKTVAHGWRWLTIIDRRKWAGNGCSGWDYRLPLNDRRRSPRD